MPQFNLSQLRAQANSFFSEQVTVCNVSIGYDTYGNQIITSGIVFTGSGYVGGIGGRDEELLRTMGYEGTVTEHRITVLIPFGNQIDQTHVIHAQDKQWRVIWTNKDTNDAYQLYEKAICGEYRINNEVRKINA